MKNNITIIIIFFIIILLIGYVNLSYKVMKLESKKVLTEAIISKIDRALLQHIGLISQILIKQQKEIQELKRWQ